MTSNTPKSATEADRTVGGRIATLRAAKGLTQAALGQVLGVSFQQVQKYEKGRNRVGAGRLQAIADALGVPVETFFAGPTGAATERRPIDRLLTDPEVVDLVVTFRAISDPTTRASVLSIVKAAAAIERGRIDTGAMPSPSNEG